MSLRLLPIAPWLAAMLLVMLAGTTYAQAPAAGAPTAREAYERGAALTAERKYEEASRAFETSFSIEPSKEALFAWAQVQRLGGRCAEAVPLYRRFLGMPELTPTQTEAAELGIRRCERELAQSPPPAPATTPTREPAVTTSASQPSDRPAGPRLSRLGIALWSGTALALGTSTTLYLLSQGDERDARDADRLDRSEAAVLRARSKQRWAVASLGTGIVLGGAALLDLFWRADDRTTVAFAVGPYAWHVGVGGRF